MKNKFKTSAKIYLILYGFEYLSVYFSTMDVGDDAAILVVRLHLSIITISELCMWLKLWIGRQA